MAHLICLPYFVLIYMSFNANYLYFIQSSFWQAKGDGKSENLDKEKILENCWMGAGISL